MWNSHELQFTAKRIRKMIDAVGDRVNDVQHRIGVEEMGDICREESGDETGTITQ